MTPVPTVRLAWVLAAAALVVAVVPWGPAAGLVAVVLVVAVVIDRVRTVAPWQIDVVRDLPATVALYGHAEVVWRLHNRGARGATVALADELPPSLQAERRRVQVVVPARGRVRASTGVRPSRRGVVAPEHLTVRVTGPLGLIVRQASRSLPGRLEVHPSFASRAAAELRLTRSRLLEVGQRAARSRGSGTELDQLREYGPDDDFRHLDWAATARLGKPIVRTYRSERNQHVVLLLDCGRLMAGLVGGGAGPIEPPTSSEQFAGDVPASRSLDGLLLPRLDHAMDAALAVTTVATRLEDRVGLAAFDDRIRAVVPARSARAQLRAMSSALFDLEPALAESDYHGALRTALSRFPRRSLLIVLTELAGEAVTDGLLPALPLVLRDHLVVIAAVRDPQLRAWRDRPVTRPGDAYRAAAAARMHAERSRTADHLRRLGATVVDAEPDTLAPHLVDTYLDIKTTARL